jgi:hypothetical protein
MGAGLASGTQVRAIEIDTDCAAFRVMPDSGRVLLEEGVMGSAFREFMVFGSAEHATSL